MTDLIEQLRQHTHGVLASVTRRLVHSLNASLSTPTQAHLDAAVDPVPHDLRAALNFADAHAQGHLLHAQPELADVSRSLPASHPLVRLRSLVAPEANDDDGASAWLANLATDLVILSCLPEWHDGLATLCRLVHPQGQPWPTVTLALSWMESEHPAQRQHVRDAVEDILLRSPLARLGLITVQGDGPWHCRTLTPGAGLWPALMARSPDQAARHPLVGGFEQVPGLDTWLQHADVQHAVMALRRGLPCQVLLIGGDANMRQTRVRALLGAAQATAVRHRLVEQSGPAYAAASLNANNADPAWMPALASAWLYQSSLWLEDRHDAIAPDQAHATDPVDAAWPQVIQLPVIASATHECRLPVLDLPQIRLPVQALPAVARRQLWHALLPQLGEQVNVLAARYPIEPDDARDVVRDLALRQDIVHHPLTMDDVGACVRARTATLDRPGLSRVIPQAGWDDLLLPHAATTQMQSAVRRVMQQLTVLDDWGFAQGRRDRRGVRLLFYGPPGTGKTLAAEVMARALGVDLLVVDLSSLVSKWLGETEKNLAAVFDVAERSRALLLFDEADALFGKRTDTQDAQDRYANLETAYLLQRLERYEGVAVLTTNLRSQLDNAFSRRFEFIVEFPEPDTRVRAALWKLHLPAQAPLAPDVDLTELADWYALSGAQIKNAALAGAFLAAASGDVTGDVIHQRHFLWAIEREFDKAGRAHPGYPTHQLSQLAELAAWDARTSMLSARPGPDAPASAQPPLNTPIDRAH